MALDLGELYGTIGLDDRPFEDGIGRALGRLEGFASKGAMIAATAGAAIAVAIGASLVQNLNVEEANDKLAAQLGLTEAESARIGGVAGKLYADAYGDNLAQVNDAVAAVMTSIEGMASASDAELSDATARALDFAKAFDVDVNRAVQIVGQTLTTGLASSADEAFDLLVAGSQRVPAALREDLLDAVDEYGQFFASLGYSGEQAFAVLVDGANKGMYGIDKAGDAVKEFTIRATDMSTASVDAYKAIGLNANQMSNDILAGGDRASGATQKIIDGLLGIKDPATQANTAIALFGTPIEDLNTSEIPSFLKSLQSGSDAMDGFGGASERMGATLNDNASASLTSLKRQAEQAFGRLGNWALPILDDMAKSAADNFGPALAAAGDILRELGGIVQEVFGYLAEHQTTVQVMAAIIGTLLLPAFIAWAVQAAFAAAASVAAFIASAAGAATSAALHVVSLTLIAAQWAMAGLRAMASAAMMAAAWLIAIGPIGLAIAAVVGVVLLVIKYWDEIKAATKAAWDWVVAQVKKVPGLLLAVFMNFTLPGLIIKHWDQIKAGVKAGADAVVTFVKALPGRIVSALGNLGGLLVGAGKDVMRGLRDGIDAGLQWVKDKLSGLGRLIPGWLKSVLGIRSPSRVMRDEVGKWIPLGLADGITGGIPAVQDAVDKMAGTVAFPSPQALQADAYAAGMASMADGKSKPGLVQNIYPSQGMNERQIAEIAADRLEFGMSK